MYYEGRMIRLELSESERPHIEPEFEEVSEGQEQSTRKQLKTKWGRLKIGSLSTTRASKAL
ncbi:hypothetical protein [Scytonema sp. PRP1]|uniref:hypothetical protein n=1 Tax=Scytonema sp. PRP1 TaxID=3120513 RepID=UPI001E2CF442